jgi:hypothetical protein
VGRIADTSATKPGVYELNISDSLLPGLGHEMAASGWIIDRRA